MSADEGKQTIVDNTSSDVHFHINPQYVNVTDRITQEAFDLVKAAETTAYEQSLADITTPKWSFEHQFHGTRVTVVGVVIKYLGSGPLPAAQYAVDGVSQSHSIEPAGSPLVPGFPGTPGPREVTKQMTTLRFWQSKRLPASVLLALLHHLA